MSTSPIGVGKPIANALDSPALEFVVRKGLVAEPNRLPQSPEHPIHDGLREKPIRISSGPFEALLGDAQTLNLPLGLRDEIEHFLNAGRDQWP